MADKKKGSIIEIVTAKALYDVNNVGVTTRMVKSHLHDFRKLCQNRLASREDRVQAWQFVKAYSKILEDRGKQPKEILS